MNKDLDGDCVNLISFIKGTDGTHFARLINDMVSPHPQPDHIAQPQILRKHQTTVRCIFTFVPPSCFVFLPFCPSSGPRPHHRYEENPVDVLVALSKEGPIMLPINDIVVGLHPVIIFVICHISLQF